MDTLDKYYQTGQVLELKDFPFLEGFIKGIFVRVKIRRIIILVSHFPT